MDGLPGGAPRRQRMVGEGDMSKTPVSVTRAQLAAGLRELGLAEGDSLIIHSSLSSMGHMEGGAEAVIEALLEAIGPRGNLMLPAFNYSAPVPEPYFDPATTPARTGAIPEAGRKRPGAVRSLHPSHSVAVIGPQAVELTRDHLSVRAFGIGSPIDRLAQMGGKVLLLGVGHTSHSLIHVAEEYAGVPKVSFYPEARFFNVLMPDGSVRPHQLDTSPSCSTAFGAAELVLRQAGEIHDARIGAAKVQLMSAAAVVRLVKRIITEKPDILLCTWPSCKPCVGVRRNLRAMEKK